MREQMGQGAGNLQRQLREKDAELQRLRRTVEEIREEANGMISLYRVGGKPQERNHDDLMNIVESFEKHEMKLCDIAQRALTETE